MSFAGGNDRFIHPRGVLIDYRMVSVRQGEVPLLLSALSEGSRATSDCHPASERADVRTSVRKYRERSTSNARHRSPTRANTQENS